MNKIHSVIDMLTGIIGDKVTVDELKNKFKPGIKKHSKSPKEDFPKGKSESPDRSSDSGEDNKNERENKEKRSLEDTKPMYNIIHYDPEMHWCQICNIFPKTSKEYLNHLHSNDHKKTCLVRDFYFPCNV